MTTKLLCHFNGSDGATTVADAVGGVSWTLSNCELDTGRKKFGTAALYSASTADNTATATGFTVTGSGNFSIEGFHEQDVDATSTTVELKTSGDALRVSIAFNRGGGPGDIYVSVWNTSGTLIVNATGNPASWSLDSPIHWALVRDSTGGFWDFFFDGVRLVHESAAGTSDLAKLILWGSLSATKASWYDEVRITDTVVYSGATYTVPAAEFVLSQDVHSPEFDWELQPIDANAAYVHSPEYGFEARPAYTVLGVDSPEFGKELFHNVNLPSDLAYTTDVRSAEFTFEFRPVDIIPIDVHTPEFGFDAYSASIGLIGVQSGEFGREHGDATLSKVLSPNSAEFETEIEGLEDLVLASIDVFGAEFDREHKSLVFSKNAVITGAEFGFEFQPVDIIPINVFSSEYGREIAQTDTAGNIATPHNAEFDRAFDEVIVEGGSKLVNVFTAEFGYEFQPITNIIPVEAEFSHESSQVDVSELSGSVHTPEFDREIASVAITVQVNAQPDATEFDHEIQSVQVGTVLEPGDVEFDREFGSAQINAIIVGQSAEFDYEAESPSVFQAIFENEYAFDAGSPSLLQAYAMAPESVEFDWEAKSASLPGKATTDVTSAEFAWKAEKIRLRAFNRRANTPRDRVKICRQI